MLHDHINRDLRRGGWATQLRQYDPSRDGKPHDTRGTLLPGGSPNAATNQSSTIRRQEARSRDAGMHVIMTDSDEPRVLEHTMRRQSTKRTRRRSPSSSSKESQELLVRTDGNHQMAHTGIRSGPITELYKATER
jgi:hypothetical protein